MSQVTFVQLSCRALLGALMKAKTPPHSKELAPSLSLFDPSQYIYIFAAYIEKDLHIYKGIYLKCLFLHKMLNS